MSTIVPPKAYIASPPEYTGSIQSVRERLRETFEQVGIDPEPIIEEVLKDPYAFEADPRPIVRELSTTKIRTDEMENQAITDEATSSLESLKMYVDQRIEQLHTLMRAAAEDIVTDRDAPFMYALCMAAYERGFSEFSRTAREWVGPGGSKYLESFIPFFRVSLKVGKDMVGKGKIAHSGRGYHELHYPALAEIIHRFGLQTPKELAKIEAASTREEFIFAVFMARHTTLPSNILEPVLGNSRACGMQKLRECLNGEYEDQVRVFCLNNTTGRFASYCLENYPRVVEENFCFNGDVGDEPRAAYKQLVDDWRALSPEEKNVYSLM